MLLASGRGLSPVVQCQHQEPGGGGGAGAGSRTKYLVPMGRGRGNSFSPTLETKAGTFEKPGSLSRNLEEEHLFVELRWHT